MTETPGPSGANQRVQQLLAEYGSGDVCVANLLCDRHEPDAIAVSVIRPDLHVTDLTFGELRERSEQLAAGLARLGVESGSRVAALMSKTVDLPVVMLAIWRLGAVYVPLFTGLEAQALAVRLRESAPTMVIVDAGQRAKLDLCASDSGTWPWTVIVSGIAFEQDLLRPSDHRLHLVTSAEDWTRQAAVVGANETIVQLYTSGTTGQPKGVAIPARALAAFVAYQEFGLDHRNDDVFWNAADPGWAYGLYYSLIAPLATGRRTVLLDGGFSAATTWRVLQHLHVTNFAAAPTVYRALRASDEPVPDGLVLRCASSAGEPLNPDVVTWAEQAIGIPVRDHYGQTELGMVAINAQWPQLLTPLKPGSMGKAMPGFSVAVLSPNEDSEVAPGGQGRIAIDVAHSPLMWFSGYNSGPPLSGSLPAGKWHVTGDTAYIDEDGYIFFSGRDDDVIIMAGYRIGPFEVESVLVSHPAVAEAAVIAVPDEIRGELAEAFVVLRDGFNASEQLAAELEQLVKTRYAAHAYPRRIHFAAELPKTSSGKILRYKLRLQRRAELTNGIPETGPTTPDETIRAQDHANSGKPES
jgi:acetyl-CoA synthetase